MKFKTPVFAFAVVLALTQQSSAGDEPGQGAQLSSSSCALKSMASAAEHSTGAPALACAVDKSRFSRRLDTPPRNYSPAQACMTPEYTAARIAAIAQ